MTRVLKGCTLGDEELVVGVADSFHEEGVHFPRAEGNGEVVGGGRQSASYELVEP